MPELANRLWRNRWLVLWLLVGLPAVLLAGFLGGYAYARGGFPWQAPAPAPATSRNDFALLAEVRDVIESEYYRPADADPTKLLQGAARGMVQALGDPHSAYEPPPEREVNDSRWTGRYEGVGIYVDQRDGQMVVTAPIEGGPAERAGVLAGDIIVEVDGRPLNGLPLTDQTRAIRGPKGTTVVLGIRRAGVDGLLRIAVVRDEVHLISARGRMLDNGLGVLRITQFTEQTPEEARQALEALLAQRPAGLVLDLRGNAGGLLEPSVQVAGFFLGGGTVVREVHAGGQERLYDAPDAPPLTDLPLQVIVDHGSASASEVLAAALRDRGRAELVGERTYGKNTVQYIHRLSDGSGLRITVAEWRTPSGQLIPATGLEPDWPVIATSAPSGGDPFLDVAARRLLAQIAPATP